ESLEPIESLKIEKDNLPDGVIQGTKPVIRLAPIDPEIIARGDGQFLWPTNGRITQNFVWYHKGLDIANNSAPSIAAADAGTVVYAGCLKWGYGCHVIIDHGNGFQTLYAHLTQYYVNVGDAVARGQSIGQMGSTGRSTGTHLHFEVRKNGTAFNPMSFLQ
ncbi:MAG: M23 family metallopeptidase, partial [bacterium]|nr:M23 family metallopeptidase [bacterium]